MSTLLHASYARALTNGAQTLQIIMTRIRDAALEGRNNIMYTDENSSFKDIQEELGKIGYHVKHHGPLGFIRSNCNVYTISW